MTTSESTPEDRQEQASPVSGDAPATDVPDVPLEASAPDVVEQAVEVELDEDERR